MQVCFLKVEPLLELHHLTVFIKPCDDAHIDKRLRFYLEMKKGRGLNWPQEMSCHKPSYGCWGWGALVVPESRAMDFGGGTGLNTIGNIAPVSWLSTCNTQTDDHNTETDLYEVIL